ncbi:hypothetical protein ILUMI_25481 [Ignelater luminosus]|uniref:Uncharacterized protein n=1 Tax=Ignelater luminosus TaxID=2038154 RepID=A0A8K0C8F9_IGNLU|nr:hypothetical protein ILUMI_25481 [Ignelater luminosus]
MALCSNVYKSNYLFCRYLFMASGTKWLKCFIRRHGDKSIALDSTDCLDDFTTQLIQTKLNKWEVMRANRQILCSEREQVKVKSHAKEITVNVEYLDVNKLGMLLRDAVEADNISYVNEIVNECIKWKRLPTVSVLLQTLSYCSQYGDKNIIATIVKLCTEVQPALLKDYYDFKHYMAKAIWVKGDINNAIIMFEDVYRNHSNSRRTIRSMLKQLLLDAVATRGEAALLNMISFAERLLNDFKDFYPLACIWQACFISEWFTDQTLALELLEEKDGLLKVISSQLPFIVALSLKKTSN